MKINKIYEFYSLVVGFAAVLVLTIYLLAKINTCLWFFDATPWIRISEIIMGISVLPYYLIKLTKIFKQK